MYKSLCSFLVELGTNLIYFTSPSLTKYLEAIKKDYNFFHYENVTDEKIAFELGLAGSIASKRTACIFSTEEVVRAMDPIMTSAYTGVKGGFLVLCIKETPQDISFIGLFSKLPVLIWEDREGLFSTVEYSFKISEKYEIPVILQISPDEDFDNAGIKISPSRETFREAFFEKDVGRWAATPSFRYTLHEILNKKIVDIRREFEEYKGNKIIKNGNFGVITTKKDIIDFYSEDASILKLSTVFPLPYRLVNDFIKQMDEIALIEEGYPLIELQIEDRQNVQSEIIKIPSRIKKREEYLYGFQVVRDWLGPSSSINIAHGIKKTEKDKKILAITHENNFIHSGMPAFINVLYNNSSFVLMVMVSEKEKDIVKFMEGCGFRDYFYIDSTDEIEKFTEKDELTVIFYRGMI